MNIYLANTAANRRDGIVPNPKAKLRQQVREVMRFYHYSERTEEAYWGWIKPFNRIMEKPGLGVKSPLDG